MNSPALNDAARLVARVLLSLMFIMAGWSKITGYAGTQGYMASAGVPGALLPLVILTELGGGLAILLGWQTRIAAIALAGFTALAALLFHFDFGNQMQQLLFMKNLTIVGGFLALFAAGAGRYSIDGMTGSAASGKPALA